jgi:hypothetical protein
VPDHGAEVLRFVPRGYKDRNTCSTAPTAPTYAHKPGGDFYEKALFVKVDLATALWLKQLLSLSFALCFYSL